MSLASFTTLVVPFYPNHCSFSMTIYCTDGIRAILSKAVDNRKTNVR